MKNVLMLLREYLIPIIILAAFPLLDLLLSLESKVYGKMAVDTVVIDLAFTGSDTLSSDMEQDENESISLKERINPNIAVEYKKAEDLFRIEEYNKAGMIWKELLKNGIQRHILFNNLGVISSKKQDYQSADSLFRLSISEDSLYYNSWYNLARTVGRRGENDLAIVFYKRALEINPQKSSAWFNLSLQYISRLELNEADRCIKRAEEIGFEKGRIAYTRGRLAVKNEDTLGALVFFDKAVKYNPSSISARYQKIPLLLGQGREKEAVSVTEELLKIDGRFYQAELALVKYRLDKKDYLSAAKLLSKLKQNYPENIEILYEEAKLLGLQGRDRDALKIYDRIVHLDNKNPRVYYNIAVNMMDIGKEAEGEKAYKRALTVDPFHWPSAYNLGVYYLKNDRLKEAEKLLYKSTSINSNHVQSRYNLALAYQKMKMREKAEQSFKFALDIDSKHVSSLYNLALIKMSRKMTDEADSLFQFILDIDPAHSKSIFNLGLISKRENRDRDALKFFQKAVNISDGYAKASFNIAMIHAANNNVKAAHKALDKSLEDDSQYLKAYLKKADLFVASDANDDAREILLLAEKNVNSNTRSLEKIADKFIKMEHFSESNRILLNLLREDQHNYKIISKLVNNYVSLNNLSKAIEYLEKIPLEERYSKTLKFAGDVYSRAGNEKKAIVNYKRYLLKKPKDKDVRESLAELYKNVNQYKGAAKEFKKLYRMNKKNYDFAASAGYMFLKADDYKSSLYYFREAKKLKPNMKTPHYYIALLLNRQNILDSAAIAWNEFIEKYPEDGRGYLQLGKILQSKKQTNEAGDMFNKAAFLKEESAYYYLAENLYNRSHYVEAEMELNKYLIKNSNSKKGKKLLKEIKKKI